MFFILETLHFSFSLFVFFIYLFFCFRCVFFSKASIFLIGLELPRSVLELCTAFWDCVLELCTFLTVEVGKCSREDGGLV